MSEFGKEIRSNFFSKIPGFGYIQEEDKFMFLADKPKYKLNIIGSGDMGGEHMRISSFMGKAQINGIYDTHPASAEYGCQMYSMFSPGAKLVIYDSLDAACNDPEADGLIICTPNFTHIDVVRVAAKSGKHILLEKPMATTIADAYEITQIAQNHKAVFQIGLQYRFKAIYAEAIHEVLHRKALGEVKLVSILEHRVPFLDKVGQWNKFSKFSGGTLVEKCCHYFDLLNLFAQSRPVSVYAAGSMAVNFKKFDYKGEKSDIIDSAYVTVEYENGIRASFNLCMFSPMFYEEITICGDEGRLRAYEGETYQPGPRLKTYLEVMRGELGPSKVSTPHHPGYIEDTGHNGATYYEHMDFFNNIEGKPSTAAKALEGFWSIVVGVAAEESIKTRGVVEIDGLLKRNGIKL